MRWSRFTGSKTASARTTTTIYVSYVGPNGRVRRDFADLVEAKAEANKIAKSIAGFDAAALNLNGDDARNYQEACDTIRPTGLSLRSVAQEFARAFGILGGAHIVEAARYYKQHVDVDLPRITAADAVEKFRAGERGRRIEPTYLKDIACCSAISPDDFQCPLASIQPDDLREYLNAKRISLVSKENRRRMLVVLFNFAKSQGWLRKNEETAAGALGTYKIKRSDVEIYSPSELSKLLNAADRISFRTSQ